MTTTLEKIEARMASGEEFTFQQLWLSFETGNDQENVYRLVDRTIQKWRKAGLISFVRQGNRVIWSLTDEGKSARKAGEA